jgi:hypothetical protein
VTSPALPTFAFRPTLAVLGSRNGVVIFGNQMDKSSKFVAHFGAAIIQVTGLKSGRRLSGSFTFQTWPELLSAWT